MTQCIADTATRKLDYLFWHEARKLESSDFKDLSPLPFGVAAIACTSILINPNGFNSYTARAIFVRDVSQFDPRFKDSTRILNHEQLHFDITHYFASQLDLELKAIKSKDVTTTSKILSDLYFKYCKKLDQMQRQYDEETDHGLNIEAQAMWERSVKLMIIIHKIIDPK